METVNLLWILVAAVLVIFMQAGFALLEAGSTRMKNAGHVAGKTVFTFGLAALVFYVAGFGLTFGEGNAFIGLTGFFMTGIDQVFDVPTSVFFPFQFAFAAVSLAIAFGGFAERAKLTAYFVFTIVFVTIIYPVIGHWIWGGGWLGDHGKQDFAGSTVVHLTGAVAAFVATIILKPRLGRYNANGTSNPIPGHNQVYTTLGVIILWVGWFGFNPGSALGVSEVTLHTALTTLLAASAGAVFAFIASWLHTGKADITAMLNGVLAALVAITASCAFVESWASIIIGAIGGLLSYYASIWIERKGIDEPIYAFSVHGIPGIWGTLSTGLFASPYWVEMVGVGKPGLFYGGGFSQLWVQTLGVLASGLYVAIITYVVLKGLDVVIGLRVTEEEEIMGLDISEHGAYGYPEHLQRRKENVS
jgi:Amt family ammonium transporter